MTGALDDLVIDALDDVVDPCSAAMGLPLGLVEMGLVEAVDVDETAGTVAVRLRVTSPACTFGARMADAARTRLEQLPGVVSVRVAVDPAGRWAPELLPKATVVRLADRRRQSRALDDLRPFDWSGRSAGG